MLKTLLFIGSFAAITVSHVAMAADVMPSNLKRDLVLEASLEGSATVQPGEPIELNVKLVNRSKGASYPVVKPGDGSECGWREPYIYFTADRKTDDGQWQPAPKVQYGRCGLFDSNWQKDVVVLKPGESIAIKDWLPLPSYMLELQKAGEWRLQVHYKFTKGAQRKGGKRLSGEVGPETDRSDVMKGMPAFELVSAPITLNLVRPLEVKIRVKKDLKVKTKTSLASLFHVQLVNVSKEPQSVVEPTTSGESRLQFEFDGQMPGWRPMFFESNDSKSVNRTLRPGASLRLLSSRNGGHWEYPVEDTVRVRAVFTTTTWKPGSIVKSGWVELKVKQ